MQREFSAGGIVFNKNGQILLIQNESMKDHNINYWGFPKGAIEKNESSKEAALREVKEETGIEAQILEKVGDSKYVYQRDGEKIFKVVTIFLMEYLSGEVKYQTEELLDAKWVIIGEAMEILSFQKDKELLKVALELRNERAA